MAVGRKASIATDTEKTGKAALIRDARRYLEALEELGMYCKEIESSLVMLAGSTGAMRRLAEELQMDLNWLYSMRSGRRPLTLPMIKRLAALEMPKDDNQKELPFWR